MTAKSHWRCPGQNLKELSKKYKINYPALISRLNRGWPLTKALKAPIDKSRSGYRRGRKMFCSGGNCGLDERNLKDKLTQMFGFNRTWK